MRPKSLPPSLYAHDVQQRVAQSVHTDVPHAKGVLGRLMDALTSQPTAYRTGLYSTGGNVKMVEGAQAADIVDPREGVVR